MRVYVVEVDVDDSGMEPRCISLVAERDRGWARAHLCLDYLLSIGSRSVPRPYSDRLRGPRAFIDLPLDGLSLFQGHLHTSSLGDTLDVQPVCVWVDERARQRYEPTAGNAHLPLLFEAPRAMPFVASPQELVALACSARQCMGPPRRARGLPGARVPAIPRRAQRRGVALALAQCAGGAPTLRRLTPGCSAAHGGEPTCLRCPQRRLCRRRAGTAVAQSGADRAYALRCAPGGGARRV